MTARHSWICVKKGFFVKLIYKTENKLNKNKKTVCFKSVLTEFKIKVGFHVKSMTGLSSISTQSERERHTETHLYILYLPV